MGANESREDVPDPAKARVCHYDVLGIERNATDDEIKRAYRRQALLWHPDKNAHRVEEATYRFTLIQQANEVLSDPNERAWYDSHRDQILRGDDEESDELDLSKPSTTKYSGSGISTEQLMRFFDPNMSKGFNDSDKGFFTIYRNLFQRLNDEESSAAAHDSQAAQDYHHDLPSFGSSKTGYEKEQGADTVKSFYSLWAGFGSIKSFAWKDQYRLSDAPDRRVKRLMEKENKKARDVARREYSETVRNLVKFLRKRDPRVQAVDSAEAAKTALERAKEQSRRDRLAHQRAAMENYTEQAWQAPVQESSDESQDDADDGEEYVCVACDKAFKSESQWTNHEKSKKHQRNVENLKKEMLEEEILLDEESQEESDEDVEEDAKVDFVPQPKAEDAEDASVNDTSLPSDSESDSDDLLPDLITRAQEKKKRKKQGRRPNWGTDHIHIETATTNSGQAPPKKKVREKKPPPPPPEPKKKKVRKPKPKKEETPSENVSSLADSLDSSHISTPAEALPLPKKSTIPTLEELEALFSDEDEATAASKENRTAGPEGIPDSQVTKDKALPNAAATADESKPEVNPTTPPPSETLDNDSPVASSDQGKPSRKERKKQASVNGHSEKCNVCSQTFPTRNQLFKHVQSSGHALAAPAQKGKKKR